MAGVARDNVAVIRIPRKIVLDEVIKKLGGRKAEYRCFLHGRMYQCNVRTVIKTNEENTSGKLEQAFGHLANNIADAEESAAIALIEVLKVVYRFEIDDVNFYEKARNELCKEKLEKELVVVKNLQERQAEGMKLMKKGWGMVLDDMEFAHEAVKDMCGSALAVLPEVNCSVPETEFICSASYLDDWLEGKIRESRSYFMDTNTLSNDF